MLDLHGVGTMVLLHGAASATTTSAAVLTVDTLMIDADILSVDDRVVCFRVLVSRTVAVLIMDKLWHRHEPIEVGRRRFSSPLFHE